MSDTSPQATLSCDKLADREIPLWGVKKTRDYFNRDGDIVKRLPPGKKFREAPPDVTGVAETDEHGRITVTFLGDKPKVKNGGEWSMRWTMPGWW